MLNQFNSNDYVGKPIRVGFNNLIDAHSYTINLRLFEQSILNRVDNLSIGKYYLLDKLKNELIEIDSNTSINFTANSNINNQFELYWNEKPINLGTSEIEKSNSRFIFKENTNKYVRFEKNNTSANFKSMI